jgi:hypothetical protein
MFVRRLLAHYFNFNRNHEFTKEIMGFVLDDLTVSLDRDNIKHLTSNLRESLLYG